MLQFAKVLKEFMDEQNMVGFNVGWAAPPPPLLTLLALGMDEPVEAYNSNSSAPFRNH